MDMYVLNSLEFDVFGIVLFLYLFYHVFAKCVGEAADSSHQVNLMNYIYDSESEEKTAKGKSRRRRPRRKKKQKRDGDYTKKDVLNMIKLLLKSKLVTKEYQKYSELPPEFGVEYYNQKSDITYYPEAKTPQGRKPLPDPMTKVKYQFPSNIHYTSTERQSTSPPVQRNSPPLPVQRNSPPPPVQRNSPPPQRPEPKITYYLETNVQAYPELEFPSSIDPQQQELEIQRNGPPESKPESKITYYLESNVEAYPQIGFPSSSEPLPESETKIKYQSQPDIEYREPGPEIQRNGPLLHKSESKITYHLEPDVSAFPELEFPSSSEPQRELEIQPNGPLPDWPEIQRTSTPPHKSESKITYYLEPNVEALPEIEFPSSSEPQQEPEIQRDGRSPYKPESKITYTLEPDVEAYPEIGFPSSSEPPLETETKIKYQSQPDIEYRKPGPEVQRYGPPQRKPESKITYYLDSNLEVYPEIAFPSSSESPLEPETKIKYQSQPDIEYREPGPEVHQNGLPPRKPDPKITYTLEPDVEAYPEIAFPSSSELPLEPESKIKYQSQPDVQYREPEPEVQRNGLHPRKPDPKITYTLEPDVEAYPELTFPSSSEPPQKPESKIKYQSQPDIQYRQPEPEVQRNGLPPLKPDPKITYSLEPNVEAYPELAFPSSSEPPLEPETKIKYQSQPDVQYHEPGPEIQRDGLPPHKPESKITYYLEPDVEAYPQIGFPSSSEPPLEPESKIEYQSQPDIEYCEPGSPPRKPESKISYYLEPDVEAYPELEFPSSSELPQKPETKIKYQSEPDSEYSEPRPEIQHSGKSTPELRHHRIPSPEPIQHDTKPQELAPKMYFQPEIEYDMPPAPDEPLAQPQQGTGAEAQPVPNKPQLEIKDKKKTVVKPDLEPEQGPKMYFQPEIEYEMPPAPDTPVTQPQPQQGTSAEPQPVSEPQLVSKDPKKTVVKRQFKPKLEPVSEPKLEPVSEPKLEPVSEPKLEPVSEPKLEPVSEPILEHEPDLQPEPEPVLQSQPQPVLQPKLEPVVQPELKPVETEPETQYEIEMKPRSEPDLELPHKVSEPEAKLQTEMETQTDVELEFELGHHHVTKLQLATDAEHQHVTELQLKTACQRLSEFQLETDCEHVTDLQLEFVSQHLTKLQIVTETKHKHMTSTDHRHVTEVQLKNVTPPQSHEAKPDFQHKTEPESRHSSEPEYNNVTITKYEPKTDIDQLHEPEPHHHEHDLEAELLRMREHQHEADSDTDIHLKFKSYAVCDHITKIELGRDSVYQSEPELWHASETLLRQHTQHRYIPERKCEHGSESWLKTVKSDLHATGLQIGTECKDEHVALVEGCIRPEYTTQYMCKSDTESSDQLMAELQFETDTESEASYHVETKTWCETLAELQFDTETEYEFESEYELESECKPGREYLFKRAPQIGIRYPSLAKLQFEKTDKECGGGGETKHQHAVSLRPEVESRPCGSVTTCQVKNETKQSEEANAELEQKGKTDHQHTVKLQPHCMSDFQIESVPSSHLFTELLAGRDTEHWNMSNLMSETQTDRQCGTVQYLPQCKTKDDSCSVAQTDHQHISRPQFKTDDVNHQHPFNPRAETRDDHGHVSDSELVTDVDPPHLTDSQHEIRCPFGTARTTDQPRPSYPRVCEESNQNNANRFILTLIIPYS
eukprot:XP_014789825.1 PREDICTED: titin-like isoform X2 [Octopus bimaculoides]